MAQCLNIVPAPKQGPGGISMSATKPHYYTASRPRKPWFDPNNKNSSTFYRTWH